MRRDVPMGRAAGRSARFVALLLTQLLAVPPWGMDVAAQTAGGGAAQRPHILVTNDDGIGSAGIAAMADALRPFADVVVVAPQENQSGASQSTVIRTILAEVKPFHRDGVLFGYGINGRPADAVKFGLLHLGVERPFDLVVSGINDGANTGDISHSSGTVGAGMEALYNGVPAIASSQAGDDFARTARITVDIVRRVLAEPLPPGVMLTLNVPSGELQGIRVARSGGSYFAVSGFREVASTADSVSYRANVRGAVLGGDDTDTAFYEDGYATLAPLRFDWTDYPMLERLRGWDLRLEP